MLFLQRLPLEGPGIPDAPPLVSGELARTVCPRTTPPPKSATQADGEAEAGLWGWGCRGRQGVR